MVRERGEVKDGSGERGRDASGQGDPHDLERFVRAQAPAWATARAELRAGAKRTHWMWFVFPQARGLGRSATAERFAIASIAEARAYLAHPVLGRRLREASELVLSHKERSLRAIFGAPDDLKFVSSMTLFDFALGDKDAPFARALDRWQGGARDVATLRLLAGD